MPADPRTRTFTLQTHTHARGLQHAGTVAQAARVSTRDSPRQRGRLCCAFETRCCSSTFEPRHAHARRIGVVRRTATATNRREGNAAFSPTRRVRHERMPRQNRAERQLHQGSYRGRLVSRRCALLAGFAPQLRLARRPARGLTPLFQSFSPCDVADALPSARLRVCAPTWALFMPVSSRPLPPHTCTHKRERAHTHTRTLIEDAAHPPSPVIPALSTPPGNVRRPPQFPGSLRRDASQALIAPPRPN